MKQAFDTAMVELQKDAQRLRDALAWVTQTVHQAHHEGPLETCMKNTCVHARDVLRGKRTPP